LLRTFAQPFKGKRRGHPQKEGTSPATTLCGLDSQAHRLGPALWEAKQCQVLGRAALLSVQLCLVMPTRHQDTSEPGLGRTLPGTSLAQSVPSPPAPVLRGTSPSHAKLLVWRASGQTGAGVENILQLIPRDSTCFPGHSGVIQGKSGTTPQTVWPEEEQPEVRCRRDFGSLL
jgi:hypothetical protein